MVSVAMTAAAFDVWLAADDVQSAMRADTVSREEMDRYGQPGTLRFWFVRAEAGRADTGHRIAAARAAAILGDYQTLDRLVNDPNPSVADAAARDAATASGIVNAKDLAGLIARATGRSRDAAIAAEKDWNWGEAARHWRRLTMLVPADATASERWRLNERRHSSLVAVEMPGALVIGGMAVERLGHLLCPASGLPQPIEILSPLPAGHASGRVRARVSIINNLPCAVRGVRQRFAVINCPFGRTQIIEVSTPLVAARMAPGERRSSTLTIDVSAVVAQRLPQFSGRSVGLVETKLSESAPAQTTVSFSALPHGWKGTIVWSYWPHGQHLSEEAVLDRLNEIASSLLQQPLLCAVGTPQYSLDKHFLGK